MKWTEWGEREDRQEESLSGFKREMECLRETNRERNRDRIRLEVDSIVETEREKAKSVSGCII